MRVLLVAVALALTFATPAVASRPGPKLAERLRSEPSTVPVFNMANVVNVQVTDYMSDGTTIQQLWKQERRPGPIMRRGLRGRT